MILLDFEQDKVKVTFKVARDIKESTYKIKTFAKNFSANGAPTLVQTSESFTLNKTDENVYEITIDYIFYSKVAKKINNNNILPSIIVFSFVVSIGSTENQAQGECKMHFVRYIPKLLNLKGWTNAEKLQKIWFTKGNNTNKKNVDPELDAVTWQWITTESSEVNEEYVEFLIETKSQLAAQTLISNTNVQKALTSEIKKMITVGYAEMPTQIKPKITFGTAATAIITHNSEKMPLFEKYYFNSKAFSGIWDLGKHYIRDGIDDFIAAIANFNFHVFASGNLEFIPAGMISREYVKVNITKLSFYVKDSFDFVDDNPSAASQPLGYWKISADGATIDVLKDSPSNRAEYFEVTNKSYRDYRVDHQKGYDFYLYSTLNEVVVNLNYSL